MVEDAEFLIADHPGGSNEPSDALEEFFEQLDREGAEGGLNAEPVADVHDGANVAHDDGGDDAVTFEVRNAENVPVGTVETALIGDTHYVHSYQLCAASVDGEVAR